MPAIAYMTLEGVSQGEISEGASSEDSIGTLSKADQEDTIQVLEFEHHLHLPTNRMTGKPSAPRQHGDFTVTKYLDKSSPQLLQAMASGEQITQCEIKWFRTSVEGEQEHYFTTLIEEATVTNVDTLLPTCIDPNLSDLTHMERVTFRYKKITWTHEVAGTSGSDSWDGEE